MEEHFIHCIIQNEFLYNKSVQNFKDKALKLQTWQQIGSKFNKTGKEAQAIYKSLREKYVREKKKNLDITSSSNSSKKPWEHFQLMSFLDDHTQARKKQWNAIRNPTDVIPQDPLMTITTSDAPIEIEPKSELIFTFSQSSNSSCTSTNIDNSNQSYQNPVPVQNTQPIITIVPESTQSDPITNHTVSDVTSNTELTKQLITTIKNVDNFIKTQEIHKPMTTSDDQFQSFGRTIAFMLRNIKDKKRQRKAMAELLIKMSEFDSDSD